MKPRCCAQLCVTKLHVSNELDDNIQQRALVIARNISQVILGSISLTLGGSISTNVTIACASLLYTFESADEDVRNYV